MRIWIYCPNCDKFFAINRKYKKVAISGILKAITMGVNIITWKWNNFCHLFVKPYPLFWFISKPTKLYSMRLSLCIKFWPVTYTFSCQRQHFQVCEHRYLFFFFFFLNFLNFNIYCAFFPVWHQFDPDPMSRMKQNYYYSKYCTISSFFFSWVQFEYFSIAIYLQLRYSLNQDINCLYTK